MYAFVYVKSLVVCNPDKMYVHFDILSGEPYGTRMLQGTSTLL